MGIYLGLPCPSVQCSVSKPPADAAPGVHDLTATDSSAAGLEEDDGQP